MAKSFIDEQANIRNVRYGFYRVVKEPITFLKCNFCKKEILGSSIIINKVPFHEKCYASTKRT